MALIEGIGDEIILIGFLLACSITFLISWMSTHVNHSNRANVTEIEITSTEETISANDVAASDNNASPEISNSVESQEAFDNVQPLPQSETELRRRRVQFFEADPSTSSTGAENSKTENTPTSTSSFVENITQSITSTAGNLFSSKSSEPESVHLEPDVSVSDSGPPPEGFFRVRLRFIHDDDRLVLTTETETLEQFKNKNFSSEVTNNKNVRFVFNGHELLNKTATLFSLGIRDLTAIHCLISDRPVAPSSHNQQEQDSHDIGVFMLPLFGLLLGIVWYLRIMYRPIFNPASTFILVSLTLLFFGACALSAGNFMDFEDRRTTPASQRTNS